MDQVFNETLPGKLDGTVTPLPAGRKCNYLAFEFAAGVDTSGHHSLPLLRLPRRLFDTCLMIEDFLYFVFTGL